jgi:hypothetical protein
VKDLEGSVLQDVPKQVRKSVHNPEVTASALGLIVALRNVLSTL